MFATPGAGSGAACGTRPGHRRTASAHRKFFNSEILMIPRYTRPEMGRIWSDQNKFQQWLEVELAASEALAELGVVPAEAARAAARSMPASTWRAFSKSKSEVKHDVIAFTTAVAETMARGRARRGLALAALRADFERCGGYGAGAAAAAGVGDSAARPGGSARGAEAAGAGIPAYGADRPHARRACRADHLRAEAGHLVRRGGAQPGAAARGGRGSARGQNFGRGGHLRAHRAGSGRAHLRAAGI